MDGFGPPCDRTQDACGRRKGGVQKSLGEMKESQAKLVVIRGVGAGTEFRLTDGQSNIGRWDADNGIFPDVDLERVDPESKISRRHARISFESGTYHIEDLGSTNGTFINRGQRLIPGRKHPLNDGDEIILGKTFFKFVIG